MPCRVLVCSKQGLSAWHIQSTWFPVLPVHLNVNCGFLEVKSVFLVLVLFSVVLVCDKAFFLVVGYLTTECLKDM